MLNNNVLKRIFKAWQMVSLVSPKQTKAKGDESLPAGLESEFLELVTQFRKVVISLT